jgi:hypothetical protein
LNDAVVLGASDIRNVLKDVPASEPLWNNEDVAAIDALKSSRDTQKVAAAPHPCAIA